MRVGIAHVVPAGAREGVHGVGFAARRLAALRARALSELLMRCKRFASSQIDILGQRNRQLVLGNGHDAAVITVNNRNRITPIALTGNEPVAQTELNRLLALTLSLQVTDDSVDSRRMLAAHHAGVLAGLNQHTFGLVGFFPIDGGNLAFLHAVELGIQRIIFAQDNGDDGQVVLASKLEVALVAAGNRHYGTGAVIGNDVIGNPYGNLFAVNGIDNVAAGEGTMLFAVALGALHSAYFGSALDQGHNLGFVFGTAYQVVHQRAFGSQ